MVYLEKRFTRPAFWSPSEANSFVLDPQDAEYRLVLIPQAKSALVGSNAAKYIEWGERKRLHKAGECERRSTSFGRWYDLSQQVQAGPIAFGKTYNERHAILWNPKGCVLGARFASFTPKPGVDAELLIAVLNSTLTALFIEILGRASLGLGALDFAVYEASSIPVLDPRNVSSERAKDIKAAYHRLIKRRPAPLLDEVTASDKLELDRLVFEALGLTEADRIAVTEAVVARNRERLAKADSVERIGKVKLKSATDEEVLTHALNEALADVGIKRYPDSFPTGKSSTYTVPRAEGSPRVEVMMGEASLVWTDGTHVDFEHPEGAEYALLLCLLGWRAPVLVPDDRAEAQGVLNDLRRYVQEAQDRFTSALSTVAENETQLVRVERLFLDALGSRMFEGQRVQPVGLI